MDAKAGERSSKSCLELSTSFSCQMEGLYVAMLGGKIELGWLVPNKMLYLISLWETFDVRATAICEIYLRRSVLLQQEKKKKRDREVPLSTVGCTYGNLIISTGF